jgi:hypothetical protein
MKNLTTTSIVLTFTLLFLSCETTQNGMQGAYQDGTRNVPAGTRSEMDRLTNSGRTFPSSQDLNETVSNPGEICYECDNSRTPTRRSPSSNSNTCRHYRSFKNSGIDEKALKQALFFYDKNKSQFSGSRYVTVADYSKSSSTQRFYLLDMQTGAVEKKRVSHGSGAIGTGRYRTNSQGRRVEIKNYVGDPNHDGMLDRCNHGGDETNRKNMTRLGFFKTGNLDDSVNNSSWPDLDGRGNNGMRMSGMSRGVNDEAMSSGVVMHGANYNGASGNMGRSYGCPAFTGAVARDVINRIKGGSLYYSYVPQCRGLQSKVDSQVSGWQGMCN